ncbi:hypothetical protein Tco_0926685 [Tanacetum coccineum]|uniref:Uncharacterized protein n=1 Tax=Tanacetum coccineum TaxID=301880 RepID=A0ABQ5DAI3_9ASTR
MFGKCMKKFLNKDKITKANLEGLAFELLKNMFKNSIELEYNLEQCHLALTEKIDWTNPKGERFHNDLSKPLPLTGAPSRKTIPTMYFLNNDLEYLSHGNEEKNPSIYKYNINDELVIHHWRDDRQWFYKGSIGHKSAHDVYSKLKIIRVKRITVEKKYGYGYLKMIVVKRADKKEYMLVEADFPRLNQNDIKDLYLLKIQDKIHHIDGVDEFDLINALQLYIRRIVIKKRVKDAQLRVKSYKKKLKLTKPYQKLLMRVDELHKFSDGTLNKVYNKLEVMLRDNRLGFGNEGMTDRKCTSKDKERTKSILEKIKKMLKERRRLRRLKSFIGGRRIETDKTLLVRLE